MLDLVSSGFDLAIRIGALADSNLVARKMATNRRVLCASPGVSAPNTACRDTGRTGAAHECLLLVGSQGRQDVWRMRDRDGREIAVRVRGRFECNYGEVLRDAAVAGLGIALHSTWHVCEDLRAGRLQAGAAATIRIDGHRHLRGDAAAATGAAARCARSSISSPRRFGARTPPAGSARASGKIARLRSAAAPGFHEPFARYPFRRPPRSRPADGRHRRLRHRLPRSTRRRPTTPRATCCSTRWPARCWR